MIKFFLAGAAALGMMVGVASAREMSSQSSESVTTSQTTVAVPYKLTTTTGHVVDMDGRKTGVDGKVAQMNDGYMAGVVNSATTYPFSNLVTTTQKKVEMVNGAPVETVTTTHAYPPGATVAPVTTTATTSKIDVQ